MHIGGSNSLVPPSVGLVSRRAGLFPFPVQFAPASLQPGAGALLHPRQWQAPILRDTSNPGVLEPSVVLIPNYPTTERLCPDRIG